MTWSLSKHCKTRGNLPIGNLWLGARSHTYLLWWTTGSALDSCLTCEMKKVSFIMHPLRRSREKNTSLCLNHQTNFLLVQHGSTCTRWELHQSTTRLWSESFRKQSLYAGHFSDGKRWMTVAYLRRENATLYTVTMLWNETGSPWSVLSVLCNGMLGCYSASSIYCCHLLLWSANNFLCWCHGFFLLLCFLL